MFIPKIVTVFTVFKSIFNIKCLLKKFGLYNHNETLNTDKYLIKRKKLIQL
jgi:hypothetical protein